MREVPAVNNWVGMSDDFTNPAFWTDGVPTSDDFLVFTGPQSPPPPTSPPPPGVPPVPPPPFSHQSVTFPTTSDLSYAGIRLLNSYGGTVTFPANISFAEWTQNSGATAQAADTVVSVNTTFGWTGGAINTSTNAATMKLKGVLNGQIGEDTISLSSGSKIVLDNNSGGIGSYVQQSGILTILNGLGIDILEGSTFYQRQLITQPNNKPEARVDKVLVAGELYSEGGKLTSVKVDGGVLKVLKGGLEVTDKVPGTDWSVVVTERWHNARVVLTNGETLKVAHGLQFNEPNGDLSTVLMEGEGMQVATIDGKLRFNAGTIVLGAGAGERVAPSMYCGLVVTENAELWGGVFKPFVDPSTSAICEFIKTEKKLNIGSAFTISPLYDWHFTPYTGGEWAVLRSAKGFTDGVDPTNGDPDHWTMRRSEPVENPEDPEGDLIPLNWLVKWDPIF